MPSDWKQFPTPLKGIRAAFVAMNFGDEGRSLPFDQWPKGGLKIDITVFENIDPALSLTDNVYKNLNNSLVEVQSVQDETINQHAGIAAFLTNKEGPAIQSHKTVNFLLPQSNMMTISVLPESGWSDPTIQAMLNSLAFPGEKVVLPPLPPASATVNLPAFQEAASNATDSPSAPLYVAGDSLIELYLPFDAGETWMVGGAGYFYGQGTHTSANNDYYATDWNDGIYDCSRDIRSVAEGSVSASGWDPYGYGNWVRIAHDLNTTTLYGHMASATTLSVGQSVSISTLLGYVGTTGNSSGCHLHISFKVNGISQQDVTPSRKPSPMWTTSGLWDLNDGGSRTVSKTGTIYQEFWRGGQAWQRTIPVLELVIQWGSASGWTQASWMGTIPGSGTVQAVDEYAIKNTIWQAVWRGDQGWTRSVPIVNATPDWANASAWSGPYTLSGLPGSGSLQALNGFPIGNASLVQGIWRSNQGWSRTVPIVNGQADWAHAGS